MEHVKGRFNVIRTDRLTVVDDCYNANPMSMKASVSLLKEADGSAAAILGDMGELGTDEVLYHEQVGAFAAETGIRKLVCIGKLSEKMAQAAKAVEGSQTLVSWYPDIPSFLEKAGEELEEGETVLVKASHFMHFEQIVEALTETKS